MKYLLSSLFLVGVIAVSAQESLSLSNAVAIGLERNFDIEIERKNVLVAQNNNNWGEAGRYPTITFNVNQNNSITDNVEVAGPFQLEDQIINNSINPAVNLNWTLFNGFAISMNKRRFEQLQAESEGNASIIIANTIQAIILGYYNVVLQYQQLQELERQMILSRDQMELVRVRSELGGASSTDIYIEENNFLTDSINYINQQIVTRNALRNLNFLLAEDDADTQYILTDDLSVETPLYNYTDLRQKLFESNVDLQKQYITQSILNTGVGIAKASRYPTVGLNLGASRNWSRVDLSNATFPGNEQGPPDPLNSLTGNYTAGLTLSFTLFDGGRINRAIRNAVVQEDIGNLRVERLSQSLDRDLRQNLDEYNIRRQIYEINERREEVAAINLDLAQDRYDNGSINSFDFRIVQNNYLSSAILKQQAKYSLLESHIALMRLTGGLVEDYNQ